MGTLTVVPRRAPKYSGAGYALRSGLRLTERVRPHLSLNHTVMQAKPAPLGVTRTLMTRGSAGANLHDKPITTHRLQTAWQPAEGDEPGRDGTSERCTRTGSCEHLQPEVAAVTYGCRRPLRLPPFLANSGQPYVIPATVEMGLGRDDGPGRGRPEERAWLTAKLADGEAG